MTHIKVFEIENDFFGSWSTTAIGLSWIEHDYHKLRRNVKSWEAKGESQHRETRRISKLDPFR